MINDLVLTSDDANSGKPVVREFTGVQVQGSLDIGLNAERGEMLLSGVEILKEE